MAPGIPAIFEGITPSQHMDIDTVSAAPGELDDGWLSVTGLPTGGEERLPVSVAEGAIDDPSHWAETSRDPENSPSTDSTESDTPTLWITGGIHGDEATGVAVAQDVIRILRRGSGDEDLLAKLAGTVVCVPIVNPAGLRRNSRTSYYGDDDPNRYFPDPESATTRPPNTQERIDSRLYDEITTDADALVDLHTARIGSLPFVIRDRVLYGERRSKSEANALSDRVSALASAFPVPTVTEYPADEYLEENLQRSTAGAVLNAAGIPAVTVELGGHSVVDETLRAIGVRGVFTTLVELGMLPSLPESLDELSMSGTDSDPASRIVESPVEYDVRRAVHPRTDTAGLVRHVVEPGTVLEAGETVATIVSPTGQQVDRIETEHDGYIISRNEGLAVYEGDAVASMAVRDDDDLVAERSD